MRRLTGRERLAVGIWIVVPLVVWNLVYDLLLTRGVKEFMLRATLHEAGRGPAVTMAQVLDRYVYDAIWISTLFASIVALAGFYTIKLFQDRKSGS
jgi:hypothetical protein